MFAVSVLNLHEDERQGPENWIPIGWIPVYYDKLRKRLGKGYESNAARKARLFHDCFRNLLSTCGHRLGRPSQKTDTIFLRRAVGGPAGNFERVHL
jgi:hypothetical protein